MPGQLVIHLDEWSPTRSLPSCRHCQCRWVVHGGPLMRCLQYAGIARLFGQRRFQGRIGSDPVRLGRHGTALRRSRSYYGWSR